MKNKLDYFLKKQRAAKVSVSYENTANILLSISFMCRIGLKEKGKKCILIETNKVTDITQE